MNPIKIILIIFTVLLTCSSLAMIAVCIVMQAQYLGKTMGNEASGFFSLACGATFIICLPTALLWSILLKQRKKR